MAPLLIPLVASVLPSLVKYLLPGSTAAGMAADAVGGALQAVTGTSDPGRAMSIITADPARRAELVEALARIEAEREAATRRADLDKLKAELADTASARQQTTALAASGSRIAWAAPVMSLVITCGFFACILAMMLRPITWDNNVSILLNTLFGALVIAFGQVCNYWLGSSAGSKASGDTVRALATQTPATPQQQQPTAVATTGSVTVNQPAQAAAPAPLFQPVDTTGMAGEPTADELMKRMQERNSRAASS